MPWVVWPPIGSPGERMQRRDFQKMDLSDKVAIVTGGRKGIGRAIAESLARQGARVAVCSRDVSDADPGKPALPGMIAAFKCDVRKHDQVQAFIGAVLQKWGQVDILVNNAGVGHLAEFDELNVDQWLETIETNLSGAVYACMAALPALKRSRGQIINICSRSSRNPNPRGTFYNASKFGLLGFTDALAIDMMKWGIRVSSVLPGPVATEFGNIPTADWQLVPEDVADAVVYAVGTRRGVHNSTIELRPARPS
ncbi:MAG: SDR family NAD(P)-dependent oxidoreductase [Rhodospirillaceae bacterium]